MNEEEKEKELDRLIIWVGQLTEGKKLKAYDDTISFIEKLSLNSPKFWSLVKDYTFIHGRLNESKKFFADVTLNKFFSDERIIKGFENDKEEKEDEEDEKEEEEGGENEENEEEEEDEEEDEEEEE